MMIYILLKKKEKETLETLENSKSKKGMNSKQN